MFKTSLLLSTILLSSSAFASLDEDIQEFCSSTYKKTKEYNISLKNRGLIRITNRFNHNKNRSQSKAYSGCPMDLNWIAGMRDALCVDGEAKEFNVNELKDIELPKSLFFYFAGASDFNAEKIQKDVNPVNVEGDEGSELAGKNWSGQFLKKLRVKNLSFFGESNLFYYSGSGMKRVEDSEAGFQCIKDADSYTNLLIDILEDDTIKPKLALMGYSNGGDRVVEFQNTLGDLGIKVDLAFAIDPIVQSGSYLFTSNEGYIGERHEDTERMISVYQRKDHGSFMPLKLRGRPVLGADINLELHCRNSKVMNCTGKKGHLTIMYSKVLLEVANQAVKKLNE